MKSTMRHFISFTLSVALLLPVFLFAACGSTEADGDKVKQFYDAVVASQEKLDTVADDIYNCWYDAIYNDKYRGDINVAIAYAEDENSENLAFIETNEQTIQSLYKEVRDSEFSSEVKNVMSAYSSYYEFVVNVSGSFNSYSSSMETLKKELANALKRLSLEL